MRRLALLFAMLVVCLVAVGPAWVQSSDPLNVGYKPSVDCTAGDYPSNVSLTDHLAKLRQTADSPKSITGYGSTPLPCVTVYASQNQFADFQAHIQAPAGGYAGITVSMSALSKSTGPGGTYTIPAPSTSNNDIVVYREGYAPIPSANQTGHVWFGTAANIPDGLFPAIDPYRHQTTAAFPVAVAASQNQSAWVDVYIPETAPSGWYSGTATISDTSAGTIASLPVLLAVAQWPASAGGFMPSTPTLRTMEFSSFNTLCYPLMGYTTSSTCDSTYPGGPTGALDDLMVQLLDNRITLSSNNQQAGNTAQGSLTTTETDLLNGVTTPRLNTILPGAKVGSQQYAASSVSQAWVTMFVNNGWFSTNQTFDYLCDEPPNGCSWTTLNSNATATRGATTPDMPLLVTTDLASATSNSALNSIDWMIVNQTDMEPQGGSNQRSSYNTWLSGNCCSGSGPARQIWSYASCDPNCGVGTTGQYPAFAIDQFGPAQEELEWSTFRNQQVGELYYALDGCWYHDNGGSNCSTPYSDQIHDDVYGDGTLDYPGTNSTNCSGCGGAFMNVSTPIFMPSIRMKLWRDGIQDYEYLKLLNSLGGAHATVVTNAINSWILNGYCYNAVATAGATVSDHAGVCPASGSITFTGDLHDAYVSLVQDMQTVTYPAGAGTVLPPGNLSISVAKNQSAQGSGSSRALRK